MTTHLCLFLFCSAIIPPNPKDCTYYLGGYNKMATDKVVDVILAGGMGYSVCGDKGYVEKSELYKYVKNGKKEWDKKQKETEVK